MTEAPLPSADSRYLLANERTFLAYTRTALAMQVAGLGVLQFLTRPDEAVRITLAAALVVLGSAVAVGGYLRWRANDRALREGATVQAPRYNWVLAATVGGVPLIAVIVALVA